MTLVVEIITTALAMTGTIFVALAALGIIRMPDLYSRMQTSAKASTLGAICTLLAVAVFYHQEIDVVFRIIAICIFLLLTAPISAHVLCRAGVMSGVAMTKESVVNDLADEFAKGKIHE